MPKSDKENVIDLCSSSDEDDVESVKRVASAPIFNFVSSSKVILGSSLLNPYQIKKRPRLETNTEIVVSQSAVNFSEQNPLLLFISGDGMDDGVITDNLVGLLNDIPNIQSCVTTGAAPLRMIHIQQLDKWSCGFRNVQMVLTSVIPLLPKGHSYYQIHADSRDEGYCSVPSVLRLQELMEGSWAAGYDRQGAEHYNYKIVGSSKQIGAAEVSNLLSFCGIENVVIQFISCVESRSLLGPFCFSYFSKLQQNHLPLCCCYQRNSGRSSQALAQQLLSLSKSTQAAGERLCACPVLPLYLQWEGHSVTIVGVEPDIRGERDFAVKNLLVFDPSANGSRLKKSLQMRNLQPIRFPLSKLKGKDCQIIVLSLEPLSCAEQDHLKLALRSITAASDAVRRALNRR